MGGKAMVWFRALHVETGHSAHIRPWPKADSPLRGEKTGNRTLPVSGCTGEIRPLLQLLRRYLNLALQNEQEAILVWFCILRG